MAYDYFPRELQREREPHTPLFTDDERERIVAAVRRRRVRNYVACAVCQGTGKGRRRYAICWTCEGSGVVEGV